MKRVMTNSKRQHPESAIDHAEHVAKVGPLLLLSVAHLLLLMCSPWPQSLSWQSEFLRGMAGEEDPGSEHRAALEQEANKLHDQALMTR